MSSTRVDQSASRPVRELAIRKLACPRVVQQPNMGPYKRRTGQCINQAPAILAAPAIYCIHGCIIYTKQRTVKLSKMSLKSTHRHSTIPIGCHSKHTSAVELLKLITRYNETAFPVIYKGEDGQLTPGACCIIKQVGPVWPVHGSYTGRFGQCMVYTDEL